LELAGERGSRTCFMLDAEENIHADCGPDVGF
jgi:hypothetical protein